MSDHRNRRNAIKKMLVGTAALGSSTMLSSFSTEKETGEPYKLKGNVNHSVCAWCYNFLSIEELCIVVKKIGFSAIDLVGPKDWPTLKKHGVFSSMCNGAELNLVDGFAEKNFHAKLVKIMKR